MICPIDKPLIMAERSVVQIDYCPHYRGVWLDRSELDKIIECSVTSTSDTDRHESRSGFSDPTGRPRKAKKKSSLLGELFDF